MCAVLPLLLQLGIVYDLSSNLEGNLISSVHSEKSCVNIPFRSFR